MRAAGIGPNEIAAQLQRQFGTPVSPADVANGQGWWNVGQRPQPIAPAPVPPTMPRVSLAELWPREANLALAQAHARGGSAVMIAQQLNRQRGSSAYTPRLVGDQIERLRLNPARQSQATMRESWQHDALALLQSPQAQGMTAQQLADWIYRETGQVTSKGAVLGKLDRLRAEKARQELAEDLARDKATTLRATGVPLTGWDALMPDDEWHREVMSQFEI